MLVIVTSNDAYIRLRMEQYKRNQIDKALWLLFDPDKRLSVDPVFRTRIKRLLDIDRKASHQTSAAKNSKLPLDRQQPAFSQTGTQWGKGAVAKFSLFDAFCLSLGLDLLDTGFKQTEVVYLVQGLRPHLYPKFLEILDQESTYPQSVKDKKRKHFYMALQKVEIREPYSHLKDVPAEQLVTGHIRFFENSLVMSEELPDLLEYFRKSLVFDISTPLLALKNLLERVEPAYRGRARR